MATLNKKRKIYTNEGARASHLSPAQQLERSVMSCLLWENSFYEDGVSITDRISGLCDQVGLSFISELAIKAREEQHLRHIPLFLIRQMVRKVDEAIKAGKRIDSALVSKTLARVIQRPDEITEFLAIYWKDGRQPLSAQVKKGLAAAFMKFDEYQLAKYNRDGEVKLRDALFLCHAKPATVEQAQMFKRLVDGTLQVPDTWEVALSGGENKKEAWERLLGENKLGGLALLRNLRNMKDVGVDRNTVIQAIKTGKFRRVLPFRFLAAARFVPELEPFLEEAMLRSLSEMPKIPGRTAILVDHSYSMVGTNVSKRSDLDRFDAACALAIIVREICEDPLVIAFSMEARIIAPRRGFALSDAIKTSMEFSGTYTEDAKQLADREGYDNIIIITDEQSHQSISAPKGKGFIVNVNNYQNGIGYGPWTHISGWSESVMTYIREVLV